MSEKGFSEVEITKKLRGILFTFSLVLLPVRLCGMESQESGVDLAYDVTELMEDSDLMSSFSIIHTDSIGTIKSKPIIGR